MPTPEKLATDATVAIMLADGFEEVEALAVADVLYRAGVRSDLISVTDARHVTSSHGIRVVADLMLEDVDLSTYTVLFLPGGMPGTLNLKATPAIQAEALRRSDASQPSRRSARPPRSCPSWASSTAATRPRTPRSSRPSPRAARSSTRTRSSSTSSSRPAEAPEPLSNLASRSCATSSATRLLTRLPAASCSPADTPLRPERILPPHEPA